MFALMFAGKTAAAGALLISGPLAVINKNSKEVRSLELDSGHVTKG